MIETQLPSIVTFGDADEQMRRGDFVDLLRRCPIPDRELLLNMGLFLTPQTLSRILFMDFLYRQIVEVQGVVMEFGCRWGQNVSLFSAMRGIYEPFNRLRKVIAFDTFQGLTPTHIEDGTEMQTGMYAVTEGYENYLQAVLAFQEQESPLPHLNKHEVVKGDAAVQIHEYLNRNPETIVALAYFDLDIYAPTLECLKAIKDRLTRGSVLAFDELNEHACPGETLAVKQALGLDRYRIRRYPYSARTSYLIID
jgi:hypothetical protein